MSVFLDGHDMNRIPHSGSCITYVPNTPTQNTCATPFEFYCQDGECLPLTHRCDGHDDCGDMSDEVGCICPPGDFQCLNNECINATLLCDGTEDCTRGEDEVNCETTTVPPTTFVTTTTAPTTTAPPTTATTAPTTTTTPIPTSKLQCWSRLGIQVIRYTR
ncbi:suppressor of tumorigenicity 14 protein homolog [Branchiostoma lanceolatum]|uniref:suppressor of tumorigenicity 14 protein homolog n=1 Tax=Branchiostoma lanceolatum TaxID=7740 RepID=UPI0034554D3F